MSINKVILSGNLTREPELKATPGGTSILTFGLAVNDRKRNPQTEQWEDVPNYFDCNMWGARGESVARYLSKGMKVCVEGKLHWHQWQDNQGNNRSKVDVTVNEIELMSRGEDRRAVTPMQPAPVQAQPVQVAGQPLQMQPVPAQPVQQPMPVDDAYSDEPIPF